MIGGSPFDSRILLYCCDNSRCVSETYDCLDSWIAWSFSELQEGKWLSHSPWNEPLESRRNLEGKPIAGGYRGILIAHRGDEKALAKTFHVRKTWVSQQVCFTCFASRMTDSPYLYTAFGKHAPHRSTLLDLFDFVTTMCDANAFVRVPGFHPAMVLYDWLHVVDLSLTPECSASVFSLHSSGIDFQIDFDFFWWHCYSGTYRNHQLWLWYLAGLQSRREAQISICRILWFVQATQNSILSSIENLFFSPCM